jgi:RNA polymerase sigma-70 factor (ECF subfamily)
MDGIAGVRRAAMRAKEYWPGISADPDKLMDHLQRLASPCGDLDLFGHELQLACACLCGDSFAWRVLERNYISRISLMMLRRGGADHDFVDEVVQRLRARLFLPPNPRLASYAANAPLLVWMRVIAARIGATIRRRTPPAADELRTDHLLEEPCPEARDARRYAELIDASVRQAFGRLPLHDRRLLRLHHIDGVSLDRLGILYDVHRTTIARWLADVRLRIFLSVEGEVKQHTALTPSEFRNVVGLLVSGLDANVTLLLDEGNSHAAR